MGHFGITEMAPDVGEHAGGVPSILKQGLRHRATDKTHQFGNRWQ